MYGPDQVSRCTGDRLSSVATPVASNDLRLSSYRWLQLREITETWKMSWWRQMWPERHTDQINAPPIPDQIHNRNPLRQTLQYAQAVSSRQLTLRLIHTTRPFAQTGYPATFRRLSPCHISIYAPAAAAHSPPSSHAKICCKKSSVEALQHRHSVRLCTLLSRPPVQHKLCPCWSVTAHALPVPSSSQAIQAAKQVRLSTIR